jgi:hypothetical protein
MCVQSKFPKTTMREGHMAGRLESLGNGHVRL